MSHITGTVQTIAPINLGPDFGAPTNPPNTWSLSFSHTPAAGGTKLLMLHFVNVQLPGSNRLEVDLGYGTDVFTASDGTEFWTRPINIYVLAGGLVPVRYIRNGGAGGSIQIDKYGRGESHVGEPGHPSISNCDPFLKDASYTEPTYDPFWFCSGPPNWENVACVTSASDVRSRLAASVGMIVSVEGAIVSTCSVTLIDTDKVITAGHCHTPDEALTSSITFGYQVNCDGSKPVGYNVQFYKVKAVVKHHYYGGYDYSVLQLAEAPAGIPLIQMRHDIPAVGEQVFGIHHPNGAVKKLSVPHPGFDTVSGSGTWAVNVPSNFHVSGGSSGSGLFDAAGRIVGVLSNGNPCVGSSLSYFPTATILQDLAPAPPVPITRDVVVVFDRSGSMSEIDNTGRSKIEAAQDALSLFIQLIRSNTGNRIGLVSFSTIASSPTDFSIAAVNAATKLTLVGNAPYIGGIVASLMPGGSTSIGEGLEAARLQFPALLSNPRAILLLTDGMQNTPRWISDIEGGLAGIDLHAIGFGTDANIDGSLLSSLASNHHGNYSRAESGLALEKFFSHAFGNIFETGVLTDPEYDLPADQTTGQPLSFPVCGEETITVVIGWTDTDASLLITVTSPSGIIITATSASVEHATGRTWSFLRIPLPYSGERDGLWSTTVFRPGGGGEFPPPTPAIHYFVNVIAQGGPRLLRKPDEKKYYTGDVINPLVFLRYEDGSWPENVQVRLTVSKPTVSAGNVLSKQTLQQATSLNGDTIPARQATLISIEQQTHRPSVIYITDAYDLGSDAKSTNGAFEPAALFGKSFTDLLAFEGNYLFHFKASYGDGCIAVRELFWSLHVDVGIDSSQTQVIQTNTGKNATGQQTGTLTIIPRDQYGNNLGPGRLDVFSVTPASGIHIAGTIQDNGDGSYTIPIEWDGHSGNVPGVVVTQPGNSPIILHDPKHSSKKVSIWKLLFWLMVILVLILLIIIALKIL